MTNAQRYGDDWLNLARIARSCNERNEPWPPWSMGEILAVAVLLRDSQTLTRLEYTEVEALERLRYDIEKPDLDAAAMVR